MIIAFCGHSRYNVTQEDEYKILEYLEQRVGDEPVELYLGAYGAFDLFAYDCSKKYKMKHPNAKLVFITPYNDCNYLNNKFVCANKEFDYIIYPELEKVPLKYAIVYRNRWIVDKADVIIAYVARRYGGAYTTYRYAKQRKKAEKKRGR